MKRSAHISCVLLLGLALPRCSVQRACEQSAQCDLEAGGLCVSGTCTYPADSCESGLDHSQLSGETGCVDGPPLQRIVIDPSTSFQTVDLIGGSTFMYAIGEDEGYQWGPVSSQLEALGLDSIRMLSWFYWWEPENDDGDPFTQTGDPGFESGFEHITRDDVPFAQWGHDLGLLMMPVVSGHADWMQPDGVLDFDEYAESVVTYTNYLQGAGTPIRILELLAPGEGQHPDTPAEYVEMVAAVIDYFNMWGQGEVYVHGPARVAHDDHGPFIDALAQSSVGDRVEAISYAHWNHPPRATLTGIRDHARDASLPVWAVEVGSCGLSDSCGDGLDPAVAEWLDATDLLDSMIEAFVDADATRVYPAFVVPAMIDFDGSVHQNYWALAHVARYIEPGALRVDAAAPDAPGSYAVAAFQDLDGSLRVVLHNQSGGDRRLVFETADGAPLPVLDAARSCERESLVPAPMAGDALVEVDSDCIVTVTLGEPPK